MNKSPLLILVIFLAALSGGLYLWSSGAGEVAPTTEDAYREAVEPERSPLDLQSEGPALDTEEAESAPPAGLEELARETLPAERNARRLNIQVWQGRRGVPAADAKVYVLDGLDEGDMEEELEDPFSPHYSSFAEKRGIPYRTDARGRVQIPLIQDWGIITATLPGQYGYKRVDADDERQQQIVLVPDETVTIRVLDAEDRPVEDVPVGILQRIPERKEWGKELAEWRELQEVLEETRRWMEANPGQAARAQQRVDMVQQRLKEMEPKLAQAKKEMAEVKRNKNAAKVFEQLARMEPRYELQGRRRSDENGVAVFRHFQVYRQSAKRWWPEEYKSQFEAALLIPAAQPERKVFAGQPVPEGVIELRMPAVGSIAIRPVDLEGRPFRNRLMAELRVAAEAAPRWTRMALWREEEDERMDYAPIGLGLTFQAVCQLEDEDFRWRSPIFAGPMQPGERVEVDLVVAPYAGMFYGRLIDGEGKGIGDEELAFLLNSQRGRMEGEELVTTKAGTFHLPFKISREHRGPFRLDIRRNDVQPTEGTALDLAALPMGTVTDLGDVRIDAFSAIARGHVTDDLGEPVPEAWVQLQSLRDVGDDVPEMEYVEEAFVSVETDENGYYELFGELAGGRARLFVEAEEHFPKASLELGRPGDVDLQLFRQSRMLGNVLMPDWMWARGLRVSLRGVVDGELVQEDRVHESAGKHYLFFDWVPPGVYDLEFRVRAFPDPILTVGQVELVAGQKELHPRLRNIDLRNYLYRYEVTPVNEQGGKMQPDRPLLAKVVRPDGRTGYVGIAWRDGPGSTVVISASAQMEVIPLMTGYVADTQVLGQGKSELVFRRVPAVELALPGVRDVIGDVVMYLQLVLVKGDGMPGELETWNRSSQLVGDWYAKARTATGRMWAGRESVRFDLARGGVYRVVGWLGGKKVRMEFGEVKVELVPGEEVVQVNVGYDLETLQTAVAELGG